jgi:adenylate cyclase, class 2
MKEVEVKIRITDLVSIKGTLESKGCKFSEPVVQEDIVYIPADVPMIPVEPGVNVLRIRKQPGKILFTLKQSTVGNHLAKLEKELEIKDPEVMGEIITLLGFKEMAHTTKTRIKCKIGDYEICLDHVNELGDFLEIEKITAEDPSIVQREMIDFLQNLGVNTSDQVHVGYDVLYIQKHNN